jgi:hypothetical protein
MNAPEQSHRTTKQVRTEPVMSLRGRDGTLIEMILRPDESETALVVFREGEAIEQKSVLLDGHEYAPYSPENNLLTHRVIVLPSAIGEYESVDELLDDIREFIHRYVDLSPAFEEIAAHYILMTWGYDMFNEVPYLRVRGNYGSGKSRFLLTVGSLCFKPIFASGASTVSPIFRLIDQIGGTLVVDEADFWASDERAEIVKILNNGNARGFPVLRSEVTPQKEFNPRAFNIFGPKLVATRHPFEDEALESRCLTEVLGGRPLRRDIPISLPRAFDDEAELLRNKLLSFRFRRFGVLHEPATFSELGLPPRRAQILAPLLSVATNDETRKRLIAFVDGRQESGGGGEVDTERHVLSSVKTLLDISAPLTLAAVAKQFDEDWGNRYGIEVANRWVGSILRRLNVRPQKSNGVYVIPTSEIPHLRELFTEHELGDIGDDGDVCEDPPVAPVQGETAVH